MNCGQCRRDMIMIGPAVLCPACDSSRIEEAVQGLAEAVKNVNVPAPLTHLQIFAIMNGAAAALQAAPLDLARLGQILAGVGQVHPMQMFVQNLDS